MSLIGKLKRMLGLGAGGHGGGALAITCEEALSLVNEFLDGEVENVGRAELEAHFEVCRMCYPHLRLERSFREAMRRAARGEGAPPELRAKVRELLARADG